MPTYEYRCHNCGHQFEVFQGMNEETLKACPRCDGPVERLIGAGSGLIFKGSGFYVTDYRRNPSHPEGQKDSKESGTDTGSQDKKKDTDKKEKGD